MHKPIKIIFDANPIALSNKTGVGYLGYMLITHLAKDYPNELSLTGYYYNFLKQKRPDLPQAPNIHYKPIIFYPGKLTNLLRRVGVELPFEFLAKSGGDMGLFLNFLSQPSLLGKPTMPFIHDLSYIYYPAFTANKNRQDLERFIPKTLKRARAIFVDSEYTKYTIVKEFNFPAEKILATTIPPEAPDKNAKNRLPAAKNKYSITKPYILFVGTLEPRKNLVNLLNAFSLSDYLSRNYALVIAGGTDWKYAEIINKIKKLQKNGLDIIQTGYLQIEERDALYAGASLFVLPSHLEGFGMPILEAFSYGVPVCISDIPVFHEVAGDAGVYFNKDKLNSIAKAMESVLQSKLKSQRLIVKGKKQLRKYSWEKTSKNVYDFISANLPR
jgi:glycosyltransferase involved in cell wall biosynthesis